MMSAPAATPASSRADLRLAAFEVVWIFLIFFLFAGSLPPDVGESHYLVKARHYWQPEWCAGDLFCESRDAHGTFYWTFGWITRYFSLTASAWIGRAVTWVLLAWSWRRLSWALVPQPLVSLLSAGLMLLLLRNFHLAGEWIVGGVEAKGFAYVLVFLALEAVVRGVWPVAILLAGAAGAFHVLVGGWTVVALGLAWLFAGRERPSVVSLLPALAGGFALSLPGLAPALLLNWGVPKDVSAEAARIYVFDRLAHHLVYHDFPTANIWRFAALIVAWLGLAAALRRNGPLHRLQLVVAGTLVLAAIGIAIDQALAIRALWTGQDEHDYELAAAGLLRFYWFRMSDSLVPIGVALGMVGGLAQIKLTRPALASGLTVALMLLATANVADAWYWRSRQRLPGAIVQPRPTADAMLHWWHAPPPELAKGETSAADWFRDWQAVCEWISQHTPREARFLTPAEQQTFKWYAGRAELATRKDIPQDARGLVEWRAAMDKLQAATDLAATAREFQAQYVVVDRTHAARLGGSPLGGAPLGGARPSGLVHIYPLIREENLTFDVYRVPERKAP